MHRNERQEMTMRYWIFILCLVVSLMTFKASASEQSSEVDAKGMVFHHIQDSYEWHILSWGKHRISVSLPIIIYSTESGWHCFSSSRLDEGRTYEDFKFDSNGKVVELRNDGKEVRPIDFSITKTVLCLFINCMILVAIILYTVRWYKRNTPKSLAPKGFIGFMEMLIVMLEEDVIRSCIGKEYKKYSPYLLTAFFFILINNIMGLIPIFPGGGNVTGNLSITLILALCTFIAVNASATKAYWKEIFWPDVPLWLKLPLPLMPVIELFGIFTKPFALMIRLFANIMAGHSVILALTSIVFVTAGMGIIVCTSMSIVSILFTIFMYGVEILVGFIQAYVFTMLSAVFIGMSKIETHPSEPTNIHH